jgi:group I intron endonuclease
MLILESDNSRMELGGIYKITCVPNGRFYIGSSYHFRKRYGEHCTMARAREHNPIFQASWDKYGENQFTFEVLEVLTKETLVTREQFYLDTLRPWDPEIGFNVNTVATSTLGTKRTPEQVEAMKLRLKDPVVLEKMRANGRMVNARDRERLRALISSPEARRKALAKLNSPEMRKHKSDLNKAYWTPERRRLKSLAMKRITLGGLRLGERDRWRA